MKMMIRNMWCKRKAKKDIHKLFWDIVHIIKRIDSKELGGWDGNRRNQILIECSETVAKKYKIKPSKVRSWFYGYECPDLPASYDEGVRRRTEKIIRCSSFAVSGERCPQCHGYMIFNKKGHECSGLLCDYIVGKATWVPNLGTRKVSR